MTLNSRGTTPMNGSAAEVAIRSGAERRGGGRGGDMRERKERDS